ncbi:MAG TPA: DUF4258 domain-containing protein [Arenibaculum sp.]|nr:DUF4258 domain-containing protein [Arenibaculum sp.]
MPATRDAPLHFRLHALRRMAERGLGTQAVRQIVDGGDAVVGFPADQEHIMLGWAGGRPLHVVVAEPEPAAGTAPAAITQPRTVVAVYEPRAELWTGGYRWSVGK